MIFKWVLFDDLQSKILRGIWKEYTFHEQETCTQSGGHRGLHPEPIPNSNIYENFIKIKFFYLKSNFDQATQKKIKKAILYGKINFNNANYYGIIMMTKTKAPIHSCKNPRIFFLFFYGDSQ